MRIKLKDLYTELKSLDPFLAFVTGPTGSGKSTFVSNLKSKLIAESVLPGKEIRKNKTLSDEVANSENPTAPKLTEKFVRDFINSKIMAYTRESPKCSVAVDGFPRTVDQVTFCNELALKFRKDPVFVIIDASAGDRGKRLFDRGDDMELLLKRMESDEKTLPEVYTRIKTVVIHAKFGKLYEVTT